MDIKQQIGKKLAQIRKEHGFTLEKTAEHLGLDYSHYFSLEKAKQLIRLDILQRISDKYALPMKFWFEDMSLTTKKGKRIKASLNQDSLLKLFGRLDSKSQEFVLKLIQSHIKKK